MLIFSQFFLIEQTDGQTDMFKSFKNQSNAQEIVSFIAHCSKILLIKEIFVKTPKIFPKLNNHKYYYFGTTQRMININ